MCAKRPWHKWSSWEEGKAIYTAGPLTMKTDPDHPREWSRNVRTRQCSRCLKRDIRGIGE